ncbi:nucleotide disphospho-sugar-binding domain-containing protein [Microbacterium sp. H1-D42]|uniref:glycosyltransferase n=1 Tax=Microbacterium sp. H1-D42 TaxID=2925844 RepID=UPI001F534E15|nr:nucleotide disphospho-sugar-binding domain-containing protein [Microbacterium sp. H1-D42]UNK69582.1 glycosyltransferase [Microbacterium sp. H1-D42]
MSRFLLTAMPFTGHVGPMAAVARELVRRGHEVRFYTGSRFRDRVEASGAQLVSWQRAPDFDENDLAATFPRLIGKKGTQQLLVNMVDCFIQTAPAQTLDLAAEWQREPWDLLVADETSVGAVLFAQTKRMPWATLAVLPLMLPGPGGPPSGLGLHPGTNPITRARDALLRGAVPLVSRPLVKALDAAQLDVGLKATHRTMERIVFSPTLVMASGSPLLDYDRADRPAHLQFVGEVSAVPPSMPLPDWWPDLDGRRVVLVTQGTLNIDPEDLVRPTLEALADRDVLVVATTGIAGRDTLPFPVPSNARVAGFVPFAELLPRVDLAVTNGGWGSTVATLRQGIPLVVAGGDLDKPEVAARVAWSGAGVNLRTGTPKAAGVAAAIDRVLADPSIREAAGRVGAQLRSLGGVTAAADLLERTVVHAWSGELNGGEPEES